MPKNPAYYAGGVIFTLALSCADQTWATEPSRAPEAAAFLEEPLGPISATPETDATLSDMSGRGATNVALTEQDLTAINAGNTINAASVGSGAITLRDNALSGFNGVGNFVMNTGHNNNLQGSVSVTIIVSP